MTSRVAKCEGVAKCHVLLEVDHFVLLEVVQVVHLRRNSERRKIPRGGPSSDP